MAHDALPPLLLLCLRGSSLHACCLGMPRLIAAHAFATCSTFCAWGAVSHAPLERRSLGVSRAIIERAACSFYLPMSGFTQSFNISASIVIPIAASPICNTMKLHTNE